MPRPIFKPQDAESLGTIADRLLEVANSLRAMSMGLKDSGIETILVGNYDQMKRGMKYIEGFHAKAREAYNDAREERGDFMASNGDAKEVSAKIARKKGAK